MKTVFPIHSFICVSPPHIPAPNWFFYFWSCPLVLPVADLWWACSSHFTIFARCSPLLFTIVWFIFIMLYPVFLDLSLNAATYTLSCCDRHHSHSWDVRWQHCSEWTLGSNAQQSSRQTALSKQTCCVHADSSFMQETDPLLLYFWKNVDLTHYFIMQLTRRACRLLLQPLSPLLF